MKAPIFTAATAQLIHALCEWLAIAVGMQIYRKQRSLQALSGVLAQGQFALVVGCILGAGIGNKLAFWLEFPQLLPAFSLNIATLMAGQSIVGGLLGGLIGTEIAKKLTGQHQSTGDNFVLPLMVGMVVGRVGCFLAGLHDGTYGIATDLPWGIDFGDGIFRHPTQLYDMIFVLSWGGFLFWIRRGWRKNKQEFPGLMFKGYLSGYLFWRLLVDAIKPNPYDYIAGLSGIQCLCIVALAFYLPITYNQFYRARQ